MLKNDLPELLSPAGSRAAFEAAIDGGADAIYVGGTSFNARINAENFSDEDMASAIKLAHAYGVKVYRTLNIELFDREIRELLASAYHSAESGIDAFIVSDIGGASLLHTAIPDLPLHASTQMSIHSSDGARVLQELGFTRVVPARELSRDNIRCLVESTPLEVEMFVHGALCVCHSGQCLFSSLVGGRSGNRGECAQPCRLPYFSPSGREGAYLSLKDLSLAEYVNDICDSGVASLKIEGRMKSPEYVYEVTRIWRELLDGRRNASLADMERLASAFSRGGFTDGYYTGRINHSMLGVRSNDDKRASRDLASCTKRPEKRRVPLAMRCTLCAGKPSRLELSCRGLSVVHQGGIPEVAINAPLSEQSVKKQLSKLGQTIFFADRLEVDIDGEIMLPLSEINNLRREACSLMEELLGKGKNYEICDTALSKRLAQKPQGVRKEMRSARFEFADQISGTARDFFDNIYLPLERFDSIADGFILPPVILDSERNEVLQMVERAVSLGARCALVGNLAGIELLRDFELELSADYRFNTTNNYSVSSLERLGFTSCILSPELNLRRARDISGNCGVIVYGRIPLMTLEKCLIREISDCKTCQEKGFVFITDRRGYKFPITRAWKHRSIIYNSQPTYMADKASELAEAQVLHSHFIFSTEKRREIDDIINRYKKGLPPDGTVRRI